MDASRFPGHRGHNVRPLPMKRSNFYEFVCGDCCDIFAVTFDAIDTTPEDEPLPLVYKVADECPECEEPVLRWEVCGVELCGDCGGEEDE